MIIVLSDCVEFKYGFFKMKLEVICDMAVQDRILRIELDSLPDEKMKVLLLFLDLEGIKFEIWEMVKLEEE